MRFLEPTLPSGGIDFRYTFLREHVRWELGEVKQPGQGSRSDVLAVDDLRQTAEGAGRTTDELCEIRKLINRRVFFYVDLTRLTGLPDQTGEKLYWPVRVRVAIGKMPHQTDLTTFQENQRKYAEEFRQAQEQKRSPKTMLPDQLQSYAELSELIARMDQQWAESDFACDRRGILLLARSGAGKTVACRKAFYDCFYATPGTRAETADHVQARLAGRVPCWITVQGDWANPLPAQDKNSNRPVCLTHRLIWRAAELPDNQFREDLLEFWLQQGPSVLFFCDLNSAPTESHAPVAKSIRVHQEELSRGTIAHRWVVTYRSAAADSPALNQFGPDHRGLFGHYDLAPLPLAEAEQYLISLRGFERWLFDPHIGLLKKLVVRFAPRDVHAELKKLHEFAQRHIRQTHGSEDSLLSTPLLMHLIVSLDHSELSDVQNLADLYRAVVDRHIKHDAETYGIRLPQETESSEIRRRKIITAMTRVALAIQQMGRTAVRLPALSAACCLANPLTDAETGLTPRFVPSDEFWTKPISEYYSTAFDELTELPVLFEFSLFRRDGDLIGFVHDSFLYYFTGAVALVEHRRPGHVGQLDQDWRNALTRRISLMPEVWELPAEFLACRLQTVERRRANSQQRSPEPLLDTTLRDLILSVTQPEQIPVLQRFCSGISGNAVLDAVGWCLRQQFGFFTRYPDELPGCVINFLNSYWSDKDVPLLTAYANDIEYRISKETP